MKKFNKALIAGIVALAPMSALAAIDGTHHDMTAMTTDETQKCAFCHAKTGVVEDANYGKVGSFCVAVCHLPGSAIDNKVQNDAGPQDPGYFYWDENASYNTALVSVAAVAPDAAILYEGHGMSMDNAALVGITPAWVNGTGWPHTSAADIAANDFGTLGPSIACTSCHAVHDSGNPPFLNAPLDEFCQRCHQDKATPITDTGVATTYANHPSNFSFSVARATAYSNGTTFTAKSGDAATLMNNRTLRYPGSGTAPVPNPLYVGFSHYQTDDDSTGSTWRQGGKVVNDGVGVKHLPMGRAAGDSPAQLGAGAATGNKFGCYSCHTIHNSVDNRTGSTDPAVSLDRTLLVSRNDTVANEGTTTGSEVCLGCHGNTAAPFDPGATGYGHPSHNDPIVNNWTIPMHADWTGLAASQKWASTKTLGGVSTAVDVPKCIACHDVHGGEAGMMSIRSINATQPQSVCDYCHVSSLTADVADMHHPGEAVGTDYVADNGFPATLGWRTIDGNGDVADGLSCQDCHVGDGNSAKRSTAHNWK